MPTESTPISWTCSSTEMSSGGSNWTSTGSPLASFIACAAPSDVHRALVVTVRGAGRQRHVHGTVQIARRYGDLSEVLWPLHRDRLAGLQRQLDPTEPAHVVGAPVHARLDDSARHRVEVQQGDLPVGDPVFGGEVVVARPSCPARRRDALAVAVDGVRVVLRAEHVRRLSRERRRHRNGYGHALDPQHAGVGRACPAAACLQRLLRTQTEALQVGQQRRSAAGSVGRLQPSLCPYSASKLAENTLVLSSSLTGAPSIL